MDGEIKNSIRRIFTVSFEDQSKNLLGVLYRNIMDHREIGHIIWSQFRYDMVVHAIWSIKYGPFHTVHFIWSIFYSSYGPCHHFYLRFLGSHCYTDYVSNWSDVVCSIWAIISAYIAIVPNASHNIERLLAAFNSIAPTWSIGVSGAFWVRSENSLESEKFPGNPSWISKHFFSFFYQKIVKHWIWSA